MEDVKQKNLTEKTVGEIVAEDYRKAEVFHKYGIDFCCGGKITLTEICQKKGLNENESIRSLFAVDNFKNSEIDFQEMPLSELLEHIISTHHEYIRRNHPMILQFSEKVSLVHGNANPEVSRIAELYRDLMDELEPHMMKEERILFPYIRTMETAKNSGSPASLPPFGTIANPIHMMEFEHDLAGNIMKEIIRESKDFYLPEHACNTWRVLYQKLKEFSDDLFLHIHLENNILFPKSILVEKQVGN